MNGAAKRSAPACPARCSARRPCNRPPVAGWHCWSDVACDRLGLAALAEEPIELVGDPDVRDRGVGDERQALVFTVLREKFRSH